MVWPLWMREEYYEENRIHLPYEVTGPKGEPRPEVFNQHYPDIEFLYIPLQDDAKWLFRKQEDQQKFMDML